MEARSKDCREVLRGEVKLTDEAYPTAFPELCQYKKLYGTSVRYWRDAFTARPPLADDPKLGHRFNAACAAAMAGAGKGDDDPKPDDDARARLRGQALDWLRADLTAWSSLFE